MKKKYIIAATALLYTYAIADCADKNNQDAASYNPPEIESIDTTEPDNSIANYFANIVVIHERNNKNWFGPKNGTIFGLQLVQNYQDLVLENDLTYGKDYSYLGAFKAKIEKELKSQKDIDRYIDNFSNEKEKQKKELERITKEMKNGAASVIDRNSAERSRFQRSFSRLTYNNHTHNYKVSFGDDSSAATFGNIQGLFGLGASIFRTSSMFNQKEWTLNSQSTIAITRPSFLTVYQRGVIIQGFSCEPGCYSLDDFPPECKIHNGELEISDDLGRCYTFKIDYYGDKQPLKSGTNEFDVRLVFPRKCEMLDLSESRYGTKPILSGVYRHGITDNFTLQTGIQAYQKGLKGEIGCLYKSQFGLFAPSVGASYDTSSGSSKTAMSAQMFYEISGDKFGKIQIFANFMGKNYTDLGVGANQEEIRKHHFDRFFLKEINAEYQDVEKASNTKKLSVIYTFPKLFDLLETSVIIENIWEDLYKKRCYDICFSALIKEKYKISAGIGWIYVDNHKDHISKYVAQKDTKSSKRLFVGLKIPLGEEFEYKGSYDHDHDQKKSFYNFLRYKPKAVKGLTIDLDTFVYNRDHENRVMPSVKYANDMFSIKYSHREIRKKKAANVLREKIKFTTSISNGKIKKSPSYHHLLPWMHSDFEALNKKK